jgi:hypothetical protein
MAWALQQQEIKEPESRFILICLANYADANGCNAFPAVQRLCRDTGYSESTVRRRLQSLVDAALIVKGNQAYAAVQITRSDRRPTVYDLVIPRGVPLTPRAVNGVSGEVVRGVRNGSTGCQSLTPDPKRSVREPKSGLEDFRSEWKKRFGKEIEIDLQKLAKPSKALS